MRVLPIIALVSCLPLAVHAQESQKPAGHEHTDHAVQGGGTIPAGWTARPDDNDAITNVKVVPMGSGIHVTLGPAIILYKSANEGRVPSTRLPPLRKPSRRSMQRVTGCLPVVADSTDPVKPMCTFWCARMEAI